MASFISTLSLFLLVLASGYYTAPVIHETTSLSNDLGHETTEVSKHVPRLSSDDMEPEETTPGDTTEENIPQGLRLVPIDDKDELSTSETINQETTPKHHHSGSQNNGAESESAEETGKTYQRRGMLDESTTTTTTTPTMPSHLTSSSTIIPEIHSASSTSTKKYTGLLKDEESQSTEGEHSGKPNKPKPKPEDPTTTLGTTIVDLNSVPELNKVQDGVMNPDNNTIPSITDPSTTTVEGKTKPAKNPLNEGQKSSQSEEEKSN